MSATNHSFPRAVPTPHTVGELIDRLALSVAVRGDAGQLVRSVASPADGGSGAMVFCRPDSSDKVQRRLAATAASVVVLPFAVPHPPDLQRQTWVITDDPVAWFIRALALLFPDPSRGRGDAAARVAADAVVGEAAEIGPGTVIERGCRIGHHSRIGPNCYLGPGTVIGERVVVQNNASLGGVGLGYHFTADGERLFFPHLGAVIVGDDAVVGSGSVIVRGQLDDTLIGARTRLGNLVNIGHNVKIGEDCAISSSSGVAGGAALGARCNIGIGVMINAKIQLGDDCQVGMGSVVVKSLPAGVNVFGNPARSLPTMERF